MLGMILILVFLSTTTLILSLVPFESFEFRPRLQSIGVPLENITKKKRKSKSLLRKLTLFNKPLCVGPLGKRFTKDLAMGKVDMSPEEFMFIKEISIAAILFFTYPFFGKADTMFFWGVVGFTFGYMIPELWLKGRIARIKDAIIRKLPDTIDLLSLCVNAGLDFMLALKWVVEKSSRSAIVDELQLVLQEINIGKPRRAALSDLSKKYDMPDLSTFCRTLIQADRMGTSVAEALNIVAEDMREVRYRRGERIAFKAPLKMLIPLLLFIFPVVGVLVGGPIFLDFVMNSSIQKMGGGLGSR